MNTQKINLSCLHVLLVLLTPCLPPVVMDSAEYFAGGGTQNSLMAIRLCGSWEKDAQQFWKHTINLWPDGQDGMLKIIGDGKLLTEGIGGVGDVVRFGERRVTRHLTKKPSFPPPVYLQSRRTETIYLTRLPFHLLIFLMAVSQSEIDLSALLICSQSAVSLTPRSQALPLKTWPIKTFLRYRNDWMSAGERQQWQLWNVYCPRPGWELQPGALSLAWDERLRDGHCQDLLHSCGLEG